MAQKKPSGPGIAGLLRKAATEAKQGAEARQDAEAALEAGEAGGELVVPVPGFASGAVPFKPKIFNILDYIESGWGLNMQLWPVQRFIVKLYYGIPLNSTEKNITLTDMLNTHELYKFTESEYLHYLYSEGRCNIGVQDHERRELILAIGRRGSKCVKEGTLVLTNRGFEEIQNLGDPSGPEWQPLRVQVAQEGQQRAYSKLFYNGGEQDTIQVRSRYGYTIEGTPEHRIKVLGTDGIIQWRSLSEISVDDVICIHRGTDLWPSKQVSITPYLNDLPGRKKMVCPNTFDEKWATLLGVLVGDGTWGTRCLEVTVGPYPEWLVQVLSIFRDTLGEPSVIQPTPRSYRVRYHSIAARKLLERLGYTRLGGPMGRGIESHMKRIPWVILRSPKSVIAAFLRGLFETDGYAERSGRKVGFSTASKQLAHEVQLLLLNFGIVSNVTPILNKQFKKWYYILHIVGADSLRLFGKEIGFLSERKISRLKNHLERGSLGNKSATESIPYQKEWCLRLLASVPKNNGNKSCGKLGWRRSLLRSEFGNVVKNSKEQLTYPKLRSVVKVAKEVGADPALVNHFDSLLKANYFFDRVVETTPSRSRVYDLNVPEGESFVANGLTNHNSTLSGIFASYEIYRLLNLNNPQGYYGLPGGNRIQIISVATDKDQAGILFNEVTSHLSRCEYFKPYIANNTLSYIQFRTPADIDKYGTTIRHENGKFVSFNGKATLRVTFKSCIAKGLRGAGNIVVILDEMAHFKDKGQSSAADIYTAVTPSTAAFSPKDPANTSKPIGPVESRIICISSPLNRTGKFYDLFHQAMSGGPGSENMLAIQAPTWEINPTVPASYYRQKYHADPATFMTEHGAQFSDRVRGWIERKEDLMACVKEDMRPKEVGMPRYPHAMGIDIGLVGDGSALSITHVAGDKIELDYHEVWRAGEDWRETNPHLGTNYPTEYARKLKDVERLDFEELSRWIIALTKRFYIADGLFDRWNGIPLEQALHKAGLTQFKSEFFTQDLSSRIYQNAKLMMLDRRIQMYDYPKVVGEGEKHSPLVKELLTLQAERKSKNIVVVEAPDQPGQHDDESDAFVRSVWLSTQRLSVHNHATGMYREEGPLRPPLTVNRYQMMRARSHGVVRERLAPRSGMGRAIYRGR